MASSIYLTLPEFTVHCVICDCQFILLMHVALKVMHLVVRQHTYTVKPVVDVVQPLSFATWWAPLPRVFNYNLLWLFYILIMPLEQVKHKDMTPEDAYDYVRSIRPRVLLASSQWQVCS